MWWPPIQRSHSLISQRIFALMLPFDVALQEIYEANAHTDAKCMPIADAHVSYLRLRRLPMARVNP